MNKRTIRELGGEIWSEVFARRTHGHPKLKNLPQEAEDEIMDLVIGVLARYKGAVIEDDEDLPVTPLPPYASAWGGAGANPAKD